MASLPEARIRAVEVASVEAGRRMNVARASLEERSATLGASRTGHDVRVAEVMGRRTVVGARVVELRARLEQLSDERAAAAAQRDDLVGRESATRQLVEAVDVRMALVDARLQVLRERRRQQSEAARGVAVRIPTSPDKRLLLVTRRLPVSNRVPLYSVSKVSAVLPAICLEEL